METYDGESVRAMRCRVAGQVGDARLNPPLALGDEVVVVGTAVVARVTYQRDDKVGLQRVQVLNVDDGFVVTDGLDAADLIQRLRAERQEQLDALLGTPGLFPPDGEPDGSG